MCRIFHEHILLLVKYCFAILFYRRVCSFSTLYTTFDYISYGKAISAVFTLEVVSKSERENIQSAPIFWFPVDHINSNYIQDFLEKYYNIDKKQNVPEWITPYKINSVIKLESEISNLQIKINNLKDSKEEMICNLERRSEFTKLLYEQGTPLENIVKKTLTELDCEIEELDEKSKEDIRFIDPLGGKWICEVKGRKGNLKRDDIRQLDDWVKQAILNEDWKGYSGIIGNYNIEIDISKRKSPLSRNEKNALERFGFSLILTEELFKQIALKEKDKYKKNEYWEQLHKRGKLHR